MKPSLQAVKELYKKHRRTVILSIIVLLVLLLILSLLGLGIRINFLISDDLIIKLSPIDKHILTQYNEKQNITFEFENDNSFLCKSECSYQFISLANNSIIDEDSLQLSSKTKIARSYEVTPGKFGSGQAIYSFEVRCNNLPSLICRSDAREQIESSLITISYDISQEERATLLAMNEQLNNHLNNLAMLDIKLQKLSYNASSASSRLSKTVFNEDINEIDNRLLFAGSRFNQLANSSNLLIQLWDSYQFASLTESLASNNKELTSLHDYTTNIELQLASMINKHNDFVANLTSMLDKASVLDAIIASKNPSTQPQAIAFKDNLTIIYNQFNNPNFSSYSRLNKRISSLFIDLEALLSKVNTTSLIKSDLSKDYPLALLSIDTSSIAFTSNLPLKVEIQQPVCCVFGNCRVCCTQETCQADPRLYPVIFIHGHSFSEDSSPESSLNAFAKMQRRLTKEGMINAGKIDLLNIENIPAGEYGRSGNPISVRASYYYIHYYDIGKYAITTQKSERIENYALRLNEIISIVKERTGSTKVNIVAHSMGGLVAREYIRIFGENSVNKLIMVATPNAGISNDAGNLCDFLGSEKECEDMLPGSVFLKRLNQARQPAQARFYTIAGIGCSTDSSIGDGIVTQESAHLSYAKIYDVKGSCTDIFGTSLHNEIINPDIYLETYNLINQILKEDL